MSFLIGHHPTAAFDGRDEVEFVSSVAHEQSQVATLPDTQVEFAADGVSPLVWRAMEGGQESFLTCSVWETLLEGNRGGGKTDVLLMDFLSGVGKGYGRAWRGLLLRRTYPELADVMEKCWQWFPRAVPGCRFVQSPMRVWKFPGGETLRLSYADRHDDYYAYHGHQYPWIAWEELGTWPDDILYKRFMSLNRSSVVGMPRRYLGTTNPHGVGHSWIKERWRLPAMRGRIITETDKDGSRLSRIAIQCELRDNKVLLRAEPNYVSKIREAAAGDPAVEAAWIGGDWNIVAGGMFSDVWQPERHVLPDFTPPKEWRIDKAYDDGSSSPFSVGWYAQSNGEDLLLPGGRRMRTVRGDVFRVREWYGWNGQRNKGLNLATHEIVSGIVERELKWGLYGRVLAGPADSSIFSTEHGVCIAQEFLKPVSLGSKQYPGIAWQAADKRPGSRKAGWRQIRQYLKNAAADRRERPGLFVCAGCVQWINIVPILPRDPDDLDEVEFPEDHLGDETRYRLHNPPRAWSVGKRAGA